MTAPICEGARGGGGCQAGWRGGGRVGWVARDGDSLSRAKGVMAARIAMRRYEGCVWTDTSIWQLAAARGMACSQGLRAELGFGT